MKINEFQNKLINITRSVLKARGVEVNQIDMQLPLSEEGIGLDSIGRLTLLGEIEKVFYTEFPEEYWGRSTFRNLQEIVDFLKE